MADIFISYKSEDRAKVAPIALALEAEGLTVWWDTQLEGGLDYQEAIDRNLRNALLVLVLWTPRSVKSRWVRSEATVADRHGVLLPVVLEPCERPVAFELLQTRDLTRWNGDPGDVEWQRLLKEVRARLEQRRALTQAGRAPPAMAAEELEVLAWSSIRQSAAVGDYLDYLVRFPNGRYVDEAQRRIAALSANGKRRLPRLAVLAGALAVLALGGAVWWGARLAGRPVEAPPPAPNPTLADDGSGAQAVRPKLLPVPEVRGLSAEAAVSRLKEAQLRDGRRVFLTLGQRAAGVVYNQVPSAGARVPANSPIELMIERERRAGIRYSGHVFLGSTYVFDLDGDGGSGRQGNDIRYEAADPSRRQLQPLAGVAMGLVEQSVSRPEECSRAPLSTRAIAVRVGAKVCVRTSGGRYALVTIVDVSEELEIDFDTGGDAGGDTASARALTLGDQDSRDFKQGTTRPLVGGDFYLSIGPSGAAMFFANNAGQRGLIDMGDVSAIALGDIKPPDSGYYQFGVPAVEGHTYVALARDQGHFVIFRVTLVTGDKVSIDHVYR